MKLTMRTVKLDCGRRMGIRLDAAGWRMVDWIAKRENIKWSRWASRQISQASSEDDNITAVVRSAAINQIMDEVIILEKNSALALSIIELVRNGHNSKEEIKV